MGAIAAVVLLAACKGDEGEPIARPSGSSTTTATASGVVRVGVWQSADPALNTYGGAATRALIHPQLFRATPNGTWEPSIVEPGTDHTTKGARSARFRLRSGAVWSDGSRISVRDLRRTMDTRFVTKVDAPRPNGDILVHFKQRLPGWRELWSGLDTIDPPAEGVFGGPYRLERVTPGLETVLVANPRYYAVPEIGELRLVLVPQSEIAIRLMERGDLDVIAPPAFTDRTKRLERIKDARVLRGEPTRGGLSVSLVANPTRLSMTQRQSLFALTDPRRFADVVLHDEATYDGPRGTTASVTPTSAVPALSVPAESSTVTLYVHAMQRRGRKTNLTFELRQGEFDQILSAYANGDFDFAVHVQPSFPTRCWICEASAINAELAAAAQGGDRRAADRLARQLAEEALILPLWREVPVVAAREGLKGVEANGFGAGPAWNAADWSWDG